jgi:predicted phosphodiesterase
MKLGLVTDIHEQVELLQSALDRFQHEDVDQIVVIGDLVETGERIGETCKLLSEASAIGVWGNHDYGLCSDPDEEMRSSYGDDVIQFMTSLRPRLNIAGCHFTHVEPWLDPNDLADLWHFDGLPDSREKLDRIFNAAPNRILFMGHHHKWILATPDGMNGWTGECPIQLNDNRYFVVIGALCERCCAIFDTESSELVPFNQC